MLIQKSLLLLLLAEGVRNTAGYVQPNVSNYMSLNSRVHHPSTTSTLFAVKRFEKYHRMASKENKFIGALSSNLFSSRGMRERACSFDITTKAGVSSNNEDGDQSLFQKVCRATLGRLKAILLFILVSLRRSEPLLNMCISELYLIRKFSSSWYKKLIFVIPFSTLKSIFTKKDKTYDGSEEIDEVNPEVVNVAEEATIATDDITDSQKKEKVLTKLNVEWTKETLSRVQKMETTSAPDEKVADDVIEEPVVEISALSLEADEEDNEQETSKLDSVEDEVESSEETPEAISEQVEENSKLYFVDEVESSEETPEAISEQVEETSKLDSVKDEVKSSEETPEGISEQVNVIEEIKTKDEMVPTAKEVEEDFENEEMKVEPVTTDASDEIFDAVELPINEAEEVEVVETVPLPKGEKWAVAAPNVDLTGKWKIIVSDAFKSEYDGYLKNLGQPSLVRSVAVSIVEMTTEEVIQSDNGRALCIKGKNLRGIWERTLIASGSDVNTHLGEDIEHTKVPLVTADKENVVAESWWEKNGTVHRSWLRGVRKYGGGDFESRRFLTDDGNRLVCESEFHPQGGEKDKAVITWTFERIGW
jgi:hypothetical protein